MGTRGTYGVVINGEEKLTYNHFDSYPSGLGDAIVDQINEMLDEMGLIEIKILAQAMAHVGDKPPTDKQIEDLKEYTNLDVSTKSTSDWYCLTRGLQGSLIDNLKSGYMTIDNNFINDTLYCEYAYIVNLDTEVFQVRGNRGIAKEFPLAKISKLWKELSFPHNGE